MSRSSKSYLRQISQYLDAQQSHITTSPHDRWTVVVDRSNSDSTQVRLQHDEAAPTQIYRLPYIDYVPPRGPILDANEFRSGTYDAMLKERMIDIIQHCAPIMDEEIIQKLRQSCGISRSGRLIKDHCMTLLRQLQRSGDCTLNKYNNARSVWRPDQNPATWALVRTSSIQRNAAHICPQEWVNAALYLLEQAGPHATLSRNELHARIPKLLGFTHLREAGLKHLENGLKWGVLKNRLCYSPDKHYSIPHTVTHPPQDTATDSTTVSPEDLIAVLEKFIDHTSLSLREAYLLQYCLTETNHTTIDPELKTLAHILDTSLQDGVLDTDEATRILEQISVIVGKRHISTFAGETFCVSGAFDHGTKSQIEEFITSRGGAISREVTSQVTILVHGRDFGIGVSTRLQHAQRLIEQGVPIRIMTEDELYNHK